MASYVSGREPSILGPIVVLVSLVFAIGGAGAWVLSSMENGEFMKNPSNAGAAVSAPAAKAPKVEEGLM
jgi:hypothetical protein